MIDNVKSYKNNKVLMSISWLSSMSLKHLEPGVDTANLKKLLYTANWLVFKSLFKKIITHHLDAKTYK